jgi:hypothetical protein
MAAKKKSKQNRADAEYDADEKPARKGNMGLMIGLAAGGVLVLMLLCGGVSVGGYLLFGGSKNPAPGGGPGPGAQANDGKKKRRDINITSPQELAGIAEDPKWLDNPDLKKLLVGGRWYTSAGERHEFRADGTMLRYRLVSGNMRGTYRVVGAEQLEMTLKGYAVPDGPPFGPGLVETYTCLLAEDELVLLERRGGNNEFTASGPYYRLNADGSGLGRSKVLDPLIEKLKSKNKGEQSSACFTLKFFWTDAWPAVPELVRILENDPTASHPMGPLRSIGAKAKPALPVLRKRMNSNNQDLARAAQETIMFIERAEASERPR